MATKFPKIQLGQKPTYVKFAEDVDFFELFKKIEKRFETCFIFESLGEEGKFSRYSIIGFDPAHVISARDKTLTFDGAQYKVENPYYALREMMPKKAIARNYAGGLIGYLSYEALNYFEPSLHVKVHEKFDQFLFGVYTDGLIFDKLTNELFYFYFENDRRDVLKELVKEKVPQSPFSAVFVRDALTEAEHTRIVEEVKEHIRAGHTFQCEVGFKSEYKVEGDTLKIYERLREVNPSPFMYYLKFDNKRVIGASPE